MVGVKLFKHTNKQYRLLAEEDNGDVIWAETVGDESKIAGNRIPKEEFDNKLKREGWEPDINTFFTFADGKFQSKKDSNNSL
jgi:hypothetical protein